MSFKDLVLLIEISVSADAKDRVKFTLNTMVFNLNVQLFKYIDGQYVGWRGINR